MLAGKNHPTVEHCCTTGAAATRLDSDRRRSSSDNFAKADIVISIESRKAHAVRLSFMLICSVPPCLFFFHDIRLLA